MTKFSNKTPKEAKKASDAGSKGGKATWEKVSKRKRSLAMKALVAKREELRALRKKV
jgi:hypothetical protein